MGEFEKAVAVRTKLPEDVPDATATAGTHPDGTIYRSATGDRFRLRHARWAPVSARKPRAAKK